LLVPPNNPVILADAMERVLASAEFGEGLASAARAKIDAQFSLDHGTTELLATFQHGITEEKWLARAAPIGTTVTAGRTDEDPVSLRG
jgi:hypothetical protein